MHRKILAALACGVVMTAHAIEDTELKNWFNDPYFQISAGMPACPVPLGPLLTKAQMTGEAHSRVERGTSCWMEGKCKQPNAYLYDAGIAQAIRERLGGNPAFESDSLWITVKRRFVWVEGCMTDPAKASGIEAMLQAIPNVERVFVNVMHGQEAHAPYRTVRDANAE